MQDYKKAGCGGVIMHPQPGLITDYISDKWKDFELLDYGVTDDFYLIE